MSKTNFKSMPSLTSALVITAFLTVLAFWAASLLKNSGFLSVIPPASPNDLHPTPDVAPDQTYRLYAAAFTAWSAISLYIPAMVLYCLQGSSPSWRNLWTAAFVAFAIHIAWSILVFFEGDMARLMASTRVSAPIPGFVLLIWWGLDVVLAWTTHPNRIITIQRVILHIGAFILFIGGSAATGETLLIKIIGVVSFIAVIIAAVKGWRDRSPAT